MLTRLTAITSVSGGSILNGLLAAHWPVVTPAAGSVVEGFDKLIADPIKRFCRKDIRTRLLVGWRFNPANLALLVRNYFAVPGNALADEYQALFELKKLGKVPAPTSGTPRFIFCATSLQSGACWHFHAGPTGRMGDFYTGYTDVGTVSIADAVAASSAFPPGFGAFWLKLPSDVLLTRIDPWGQLRRPSEKRPRLPGDVKGTVLLTDGGVYDNLGVEPVWNLLDGLILSDAGKPFSSVPSLKQFAIPRLTRVAAVSAEQVGAVRKRWLFNDLEEERRSGVIWQINTRLCDYPAAGKTGYPISLLPLFNRIRTDLNTFTEQEIAVIENHGYSLADAAMRSYLPRLCNDLTPPLALPNPGPLTVNFVRGSLANSHRRSIGKDVCKYYFGA